MSLSINNANDKFDFGTGFVTYNGLKVHGMYWPLLNFQNIFKLHRPKTEEDFKALVWFFGGPRPSDTEKVEMKATDDGKHIVFIITQKPNGIQPEQESNQQSETSSGLNDTEQREVSASV